MSTITLKYICSSSYRLLKPLAVRTRWLESPSASQLHYLYNFKKASNRNKVRLESLTLIQKYDLSGRGKPHPPTPGVPKGNENSQTAVKKETTFSKLKKMYRDYWYVLVPVHLVTSSLWAGAFYYASSSGLDIIGIMETLNFSEHIIDKLRDSKMGYIAMTYALYKIATPARYAVTLGGTTISINYLKKMGYIKPVPSREQLKVLYNEKKEGLQEMYQGRREGIQGIYNAKKNTLAKKRKNVLDDVKKTKTESNNKP